MRAHRLGFRRGRGGIQLIACSLGFLLQAGLAIAQVGTGVIEGRVTDETDALLPGVTVTISSPALQLRQMVDVTGTDGQFQFVDVPDRRSTACSTSSPGFARSCARTSGSTPVSSPARRDHEGRRRWRRAVTVSGQSPVVDLSTTAGITNFTKEMLETVPNTRSMWQVLAMAPGVRPAGTPDVGGSQLGIQQGYKNYGTTGQVTPQLEGINTRQASTTAGFFYDYAALEEAQVKAVGNDAEVALPGTNWVAIVKSGGNNFHGQYFFSGEHRRCRATTSTMRCAPTGVTQRKRAALRDRSRRGDLGGRIIRDRLWFYGALRDQRRQKRSDRLRRGAGSGRAVRHCGRHPGLPGPDADQPDDQRARTRRAANTS